MRVLGQVRRRLSCCIRKAHGISRREGTREKKKSKRRSRGPITTMYNSAASRRPGVERRRWVQLRGDGGMRGVCLRRAALEPPQKVVPGPINHPSRSDLGHAARRTYICRPSASPTEPTRRRRLPRADSCAAASFLIRARLCSTTHRQHEHHPASSTRHPTPSLLHPPRSSSSSSLARRLHLGHVHLLTDFTLPPSLPHRRAHHPASDDDGLDARIHTTHPPWRPTGSRPSACPSRRPFPRPNNSSCLATTTTSSRTRMARALLPTITSSPLLSSRRRLRRRHTFPGSTCRRTTRTRSSRSFHPPGPPPSPPPSR